MQLKNEPLSIVLISILIRPWEGMYGTRKDNKGKLGDQGDGRDGDDTCMRHEALYSGGEKGAMTTNHGNANSVLGIEDEVE